MTLRTPYGSDEGRTARLARLIADVIRHRSRGDPVFDEDVIARNPELMPELAERLRALRRVEEAERRARETDPYHRAT